jgi:hypothetical protein
VVIIAKGSNCGDDDSMMAVVGSMSKVMRHTVYVLAFLHEIGQRSFCFYTDKHVAQNFSSVETIIGTHPYLYILSVTLTQLNLQARGRKPLWRVI